MRTTRKPSRIGLAALLTAALTFTVAVVPAHADVSSASGSRTCPVGQTLHVRVTTERSAPVAFYLSNSLKYTDAGGYTHVNNYGVRGGSWKVTTGGNIQTVSDYCTGAVL